MKRMILGGLLLAILLYPLLSLEPGLNVVVDTIEPSTTTPFFWGAGSGAALFIIGQVALGIGLLIWGYKGHKKAKRRRVS